LSIAADTAVQMNEFERILDLYFRRSPVQEANLKGRRAIESVNEWTRDNATRLEAASKDLNEQLAPVRELEDQLRTREQRLRESKTASVEQHNRLVAEYNALVEKLREIHAAYGSKLDSYNRSVEQYNEEQRRRAKEVELIQKSAHKEFEQYKAWRENRGEERFFTALNTCYAKLSAYARRGHEQSNELRACLRQVQAIRRELAEYARKQHAEAEHGMLVVTVYLCGREESSMVLDTGANSVTVTPELVEILGLENRLGEEVEMVLAGDVRVKGRKIVLPSVSVLGSEADNVDAVVLKASEVGVDGLLGLSFLSRFQFEIVKDRPMRLRLRPKGEGTEATPVPAPGYDVFISYGAEGDRWWAHVVSDALTVMGYRPFFAQELPSDGAVLPAKNAAAVTGATYFVLVASNPDGADSVRVRAERELFLNSRKSDKETAHLVTVACGDFAPAKLSYSPDRVIHVSEANWRDMLQAYLPRA